MDELTHMKCEACRRGAPTVTAEERDELHAEVPDWALVEREEIQRLERKFTFPDFVDALDFTNPLPELDFQCLAIELQGVDGARVQKPHGATAMLNAQRSVRTESIQHARATDRLDGQGVG